MSDASPIRPHQTVAELNVKIGPTATIRTVGIGDCPILLIEWGSITLLVMTYSASEDGPLAECDVERARDLRTAAAEYAAAIEDLWHRQTGGNTADRTEGP